MKTKGIFPVALRVGLLAGLLTGLALPSGAQDGTNGVLPTVILRVRDAEASEPGSSMGLFELFRDGPTNLALNVFVHIGGSASNGVDYVALPNWIPVPAGVRSVHIPVRPLDDLLVEGPETVALHLVYPPIVPPVNYLIGSPSNGVVTIYDNDRPPTNPPPVVTIVATDPEAAEPGLLTVINPGEFTILRAGPTNLPLPVLVRVGGTASNGVDYVAISNLVVIPAGAYSTRVIVHPLPDTLVEGTESVVLRLEQPPCITIFPPPPECYVVGLPAEAVVRILDYAPPPTNRPPEVRLTRPLDGQTFAAPALVPLRADAVDMDGYVPHLEFYADGHKIGEETRVFPTPPPPGQHSVFEMVWTNPPLGRHILAAKAVDDQDAPGWSPPVTIWVVATNPPPITNLPPIVTITAPDPIAAEGTNWLRWCCGHGTNFCGTNTALFVIRRHGPTNDALTVYYHVGGTASNGVDYVALPGQATIPAGRRAVEILVVPIDDTLREGLETVVLCLRVPPDVTNNVPPYLVGYPGRAAAVIVDNDQPRPVTGMLADRCFHILNAGANSGWFRIEWSSDLVNWTPLCTNTVVDGALHFVDPDAEDAVERFYRAVPEPNPPPAD